MRSAPPPGAQQRIGVATEPNAIQATLVKAVVYPSTGQYRSGFDEVHVPVERKSAEVELPARKTVAVRFKLRKQ